MGEVSLAPSLGARLNEGAQALAGGKVAAGDEKLKEWDVLGDADGREGNQLPFGG